MVTRLHFLVDEHGMNLTKALLGTIIKYPVSSVEIDKESGTSGQKRWDISLRTGKILGRAGGHGDEREAASAGISSGGGGRHRLRTADIEDAVKKGCISYETLFRELTGYRQKNRAMPISAWCPGWRINITRLWKRDMRIRVSMRFRTGLSARRDR